MPLLSLILSIIKTKVLVPPGLTVVNKLQIATIFGSTIVGLTQLVNSFVLAIVTIIDSHPTGGKIVLEAGTSTSISGAAIECIGKVPTIVMW